MFSFLDDGYEVAEVIVANGTDHRVTVKPEDFFLTYQDGPKKMGYEFSLPPSKVAGKIRGRVRWANFFRAFAAGMSQTTTTSQTAGSVSVYGPGGTASGTYNAATTTTQPNRAALARAAEANNAATASANADAEKVLSQAFWANTLFPKTYTSGLVYFERKKFEKGLLYVMVDDTAYTFGIGSTEGKK